MTSEIKLVGGPYHGNSFYHDGSDIFAITSHTGQFAVNHVYTRTDDLHFDYQGQETPNDRYTSPSAE